MRISRGVGERKAKPGRPILQNLGDRWPILCALRWNSIRLPARWTVSRDGHGDVLALLNAFVCEAVAARPIMTLRTGGSVRIINAFFMGTSDNPVDNHSGAGSVRLEEGDDLLANGWITAHIQFALGEPALEKIRVTILGENDAHGNLRSQFVGRPIECDGCNGVAVKTMMKLVPHPRAGERLSLCRQRPPSLHERNDTPIFPRRIVRKRTAHSRTRTGLVHRNPHRISYPLPCSRGRFQLYRVPRSSSI